MWLAGSLLVADRAHVRADLLERLTPPRIALALARFGAALGLAFCALMAYAGVRGVALSLRLEERSDSVLALPLWIYYAGFPVGMALMAWRYAQRLLSGREGQP